MSNSNAPLKKATHVFAVHEIPLKCDVYDAADYPADSPVFLFFHSGGLAGGARIVVPPWLVQTCYAQKWPLVSASYRLLPQVNGDGLLEDAKSAYEFAQGLGGKSPRSVIVGGASAGFFLAAIIAHHLTPKPLALLSITGIPTFHHAFFNSSTLIPSEPITEDDVAPFVQEPVSVGGSHSDPSAAFDLAKLLPDGSKNPEFQPPKKLPPEFNQDPYRGMLYDFFLYENTFLDLVGTVDRGFEWAVEGSPDTERKLSEWPLTIFFQGDSDDDVSPGLCQEVAAKLGHRARYFNAEGQGHLFESKAYIEDVGQGPMSAVGKAVDELVGALRGARA